MTPTLIKAILPVGFLTGAMLAQIAFVQSVWSIELAFGDFGDALAVGDFSGDGVDDLAVGIPKADEEGNQNVGAAIIIFGAPVSGLNASAAREPKRITRQSFGDSFKKNDRFGSALAAGDFDGNGADDLAIGVRGAGYRTGYG